MPVNEHLHAADLRGASRLAIDATVAITDLVEAMHRNISSTPAILGKQPEGGAGGISGLVYRGIRGTTRLIGGGIDAALTPLIPLLRPRESTPARDAVLAALNGVMGDHLIETKNPLAITMQLRANGQSLVLETAALTKALPKAGGKIAVMVHGLCMNDQQWRRNDHDHGAALARDLGFTPIYLRYNSGLHISVNGREFANRLETLVAQWPVEVSEMVILTHSMGGLVARSALHYATAAGTRWPTLVKALVFLGTPHHGAPLERGGHWIDTILGVSPYVAPFARLGQMRSAGITDLRHGNLLDEDWQHGDRFTRTTTRPQVLPLPANVPCYAIAATTGKQVGDLNDRLLGDGLVPVASALGHHKTKKRVLGIPPARQWIGVEMNHMDLLSSTAVYAQVRHWLAADFAA
jgi:hypothetical protein